MYTKPIVLTIAGSDCSGGAGIQADIKTISALSCYAASAITAITIQNTTGVKKVEFLSKQCVFDQIDATIDDLHPDVIKIGMTGNRDIIQAISESLKKWGNPRTIFDPVMASTGGRKLLDDETIESMKESLLGQCTLITPNLDETEILMHHSIQNTDEMKEAATYLSKKYGCSVLVKGGHLKDDEMSDILYHQGKIYTYTSQRTESSNLHGTGCTLSSAIAAYFAMGHQLPEAVKRAKEYTRQAIIAAKNWKIGHGNGPLMHFFKTNQL